MDIYKIITETYPELTPADFRRTIVLQDDADGEGAYIAEWNYEKPIPNVLTLGKPKA